MLTLTTELGFPFELWAASGISAWLGTASNILKMLLGLGFVIFVHELGHFLAAKACGVKCPKFYIGFDFPMPKIGPFQIPSSLGKFQWGETEYGIGIVPLGGYVKMMGQEDAPTSEEDEQALPEKDRAYTMNADGTITHNPRSYLAKTVPQRMLIISAGVIMNLIFAVIMGAVAYRMGVEYSPCVVGRLTPGDPAWETGQIAIGDKLIRVNGGDPDEQLRFRKDLQSTVIKSGITGTVNPVTFGFRRPDNSEYEVTLMPSERLKEYRNFVTIGLANDGSTTLGPDVVYKGTAAAAFKDKLEAGDRVVGVDDLKFKVDEQSGRIFAQPLREYLANHRDKTVKLHIERESEEGTTAEKFTIEVAANPMKRLGVELTVGPIAGVQKDSLAAKAGFKKGDVIVKLNDEPAGDPLTLPDRLAALAGQQVILTVNREGEQEPLQLQVTPQSDRIYQTYDLFGHGGRIALDTIGLAITTTNKLTGVIPGSSAAEAKLQPGDELLKFQLIADNDETKEALGEIFRSKAIKAVLTEREFTDAYNWTYLHGFLQQSFAGLKVKLTYKRGDEEMSSTLSANDGSSYLCSRGFQFVSIKHRRFADNWSEAFSLGLRETKESLSEVWWILQRLLTGQISANNLMGPVGILSVASNEASRGISILLMFLVMLSCNLAILNFLPIPILDGGHFVFLVIEGVTRRPVNEKVQNVFQLVGLVALLSLIIYVTFNDVIRLFFTPVK